MPSKSAQYKTKKNRNHRRNRRRREQLIAQGLTPEQAQLVVEQSGMLTDARYRQRVEREKVSV